MSLPAINLLKDLNKAVQSRNFAISDAVVAMEVMYKDLEGLGTEGTFNGIFASCFIYWEELGVKAPKLPRVHNWPKRYVSWIECKSPVGSDKKYC